METCVRALNRFSLGLLRDVASVSSTCGLGFRTFARILKNLHKVKTRVRSPLLTLFTHTSRYESGLAAQVHTHELWVQ